jgi:colanic acid biosynthesis glycosyl transferase WcaI
MTRSGGLQIAVHDYAGHVFQFDLSRALARRGHVVRHFFFADDIGPKGPTQTGPDDPPTLSIEPISIGVPYSKDNFLQRRNGDLRYGAIAAQRIAAFKPDVVISGNTPLDAQAQILREAHATGAAFVFWMQDFYSLAIERLIGGRWLGAGRLIAEYYKHVEGRLLKQSEGVVLISEDFVAPLTKLAAVTDRVSVIPNWGALDAIPARPKDNPWSRQHGLHDRFVFLYSGTLALKHNPEWLWALAATFRDDPQVEVVLTASGVSYDALKQRASAEPMPNLRFLPLQPVADLPDLLATADVTIGLLESDAGAFSVPSKVLSYLCAGRAILLAAPPANLAASMVARAKAGLVVSSDDQAAFIAAARRLRSDTALREECGRSARAYAVANFDIEAVADRFEATFATARRAR